MNRQEKPWAAVRRHILAGLEPAYADVWVGTVETPSGRVYSCTWRRDEAPSEAEVMTAWRTDRKAFTPGY